MKHMYLCYWRPDILAKLQVNNTVQIATCEAIVPANEMTATLADVTCKACRDTYIEALPMGTQAKTTFVEPIVENLKKSIPPASDGWSTDLKPTNPWKTK